MRKRKKFRLIFSSGLFRHGQKRLQLCGVDIFQGRIAGEFLFVHRSPVSSDSLSSSSPSPGISIPAIMA